MWGFTGLLFFIAVYFILITCRDFFKVCVDFCRAVSTVLDTLRKENFYENVCIFSSYNRFCEIVRVFGAQQNAPATGKFRPQGRCGVWFNFPWLYTVVGGGALGFPGRCSLDDDTVTMVDFVLDDLGGPAGEVFDVSVHFAVLPLYLDGFVALGLALALQ